MPHIEKITVRRKDNPKEYMRQWTLLNKEHKQIYDKKNKDRANFLRRQRYKTKEGKKLIQKQLIRYRNKHREKITKKYLERRKKDPVFKLLTTLRGRIVKVLKGNSKSKSTQELIGCNIEQLWIHLEKSFKPGMTRENHGKWHLDHIIPCSSFDLTKPEEQAQCFHYTNLQPLWASENLAKGSKIS
jgi:hypothetical protein